MGPADRLFLTLIVVPLSTACGPAARPATVEMVELPNYTPAESVLFDDQFHEAVYRPVAWSATPKLSDRVRFADVVAVARITTATEEAVSSGLPHIAVELAVLGQPFKGAAPGGPVRITLAPDSPSYRLFRWQRPVLLGKDVVLFYRRYDHEGETRVHFRAEPNIQAVHLAVQQVLSAAPQEPQTSP